MSDTEAPSPFRHGAAKKARQLAEETANQLGVSAGQAQMILADLNGMNAEGRKLSIKEVSEKWRVQKEDLEFLKQLAGGDFKVWRQGLGVKMTIVASLLQNALLDKMSDPDELAKLTVEQLSRSTKSITDSLVTVLDGHQPSGSSGTVGDLMKMSQQLEAMKAAAKVVEEK